MAVSPAISGRFVHEIAVFKPPAIGVDYITNHFGRVQTRPIIEQVSKFRGALKSFFSSNGCTMTPRFLCPAFPQARLYNYVINFTMDHFFRLFYVLNFTVFEFERNLVFEKKIFTI